MIVAMQVTVYVKTRSRSLDKALLDYKRRIAAALNDRGMEWRGFGHHTVALCGKDGRPLCRVHGEKRSKEPRQ